MNRRILSASLLSVCLGIPLATVQAGGETHGDRADLTQAKPSAPVELSWMQDGRDGVVEVRVTAGVDHDGLDLMLVVPGAGRQGARSLPAATAGPAGTVTWELGERPASAPRVMVVIRQGDTRQPRSFVADWSSAQDVVPPDGQTPSGRAVGKNSRVSGEAGVAEPVSAAPDLGVPDADAAETPALESMPAQETLKRGEPDETPTGG